MDNLFDFFDAESANGFKITLGMYLSRKKLVYGKNSELISVNELNALNRKLIATSFIVEYKDNIKYRVSIREWTQRELLNDVSKYVDYVLPKLYYIEQRMQQEGPRANRRAIKKQYKGITSVEGAVYVYKSNYDKQKDVFVKKKENYKSWEGGYAKFDNNTLHKMLLRDLDNAGMQLRNNDLKRSDMIKLLRFFYKDTPVDNLFSYVEYKL